MKIALTGDVMLGRNVARMVEEQLPEHVWGNILPLLRAADFRIINLECVIARTGAHERWMPPKAFYFIAGPKTIQVLKAASIDVVTLANNHTLDFRASALLEMLELLQDAGIRFVGVGRSAEEAQAPLFVQTPEFTLAVLSFTDNEPEWEATEATPGLFYVPITQEDRRLERLEHLIRETKRRADVVLVTAHWGPNMLDRPRPPHMPFARAILDAGADCFAGHSAHVPQGIEIYEGKPILYDLGDFVDDYAVDPFLRNDRSLLFVLDVDKGGVRQIELVPVLIDGWACQVNLATGAEAELTMQKMINLCAEMETRIDRSEGHLIVSVRD